MSLKCSPHIAPSGVPCIRPPIPLGPDRPRLPVMTVNGNQPDTNGNVDVSVPEIVPPSAEGEGKAADALSTHLALKELADKIGSGGGGSGGGSVEVVEPSEKSTDAQAASAKAVFDRYRAKEDLSYKEKTDVWKCDFSYDGVYSFTVQAKFLRHYNDEDFYFGGDRDNNTLIHIETMRLGYPDLGMGEYSHSITITDFNGDVLFHEDGLSRTFPSPFTVEFDGYSVVCTLLREADYNDRLASAYDLLEYEVSTIGRFASLFSYPPKGVYNQDEDIDLQDNGFYILRNCTATLPSVYDGVPRRFVAYCHSGVRFKDGWGRPMVAQRGSSVISGGTASTSQLGISNDQFIAFTVRMIRDDQGNELVFLEF